ncbi:hypothetical protein HYS47_01515 [Candidatus Woesearchaeota archaeon]|nr:hypothetical protein [Candidatus Woesearchaeota archaeon]
MAANASSLMWMIPSLLVVVIMIPLGGLLLWLTCMLFSVKPNKYGKGVLVTAIVGVAQLLIAFVIGLLPVGLITKVVSWILSYILVGFVLAWLVIRNVFKLEWGKSFLVWLVWAAANFIVSLIVNMVIMFFTVIIGLAALSGAAA